MDLDKEVLSKISQYAKEKRDAQGSFMDIDPSDYGVLEARLNRTIQELQARVKQQQRELNRVRASSSSATIPQGPSSDPRERLQQLRNIRAAYESLTPSEPALPSKDSVLPALLAARNLNQTVSKLCSDISTDQGKLESLQKRHKKASTDLSDGDLLTASLEKRISNLQNEQATVAQKTPAELANERIAAQHKKIRVYETETGNVGQALNEFIDEHLAAMLAAEELGGPVVGDMPDIEDDTLAAGFSRRGRPRKTASTSEAGETKREAKRQRRIDEIWGNVGGSGEDEDRNERTAAGTELQQLIGMLWEALLGNAGTGEYVTLTRDSAAARFLVRARVAQFHPRDARRLRLIDFGRELDD